MTDEKPNLTEEQKAEIQLRVTAIDAFCTNLRNNMVGRAVNGYLKDKRRFEKLDNLQKEANEEFLDMLVYMAYMNQVQPGAKS